MTERFVQLSTKYREFPNEESHNCLISTPKIVKAGIYKLSHCLIPLSFYNINENNNKLTFTTLGTTYNVNLIPGVYDTVNILTALEELLNASASGFTVELDEITKKIEISNSTNSFSFDFTDKNSMYKELGFKSAVTTNALSITGTDMINLLPIQMVNLSIDNINMINWSINHGTTFIIPIESGLLSYINYTPPSQFQQTVYIPSDRRQIRLTVRDELFNLLDLNNQDIMIVLERLS